jgi:hypothetical protein
MKKSLVKVKKLHKPKKLKVQKSKLGIMTISAIILFGSLYFIISNIPKFTPTSIGINEVSVNSASVTLALPPSITTKIGSETSLDITIDTGSYRVSAVQVELSYDPTKISTPTLTQGDFLANKLGNPKIEAGLITFIYTAPLESNGAIGSGKLATLKFTPKAGNSQIVFTKNTMVAAIGTSSNVLQLASGSNISASDSTTQNTASLIDNPPVLTDIQPAPAKAKPTTSTPKATETKAKEATETTNITTPVTYLPENDYDYSTASDISNEAIETPSTPSGFARFLALIKTIFGGKR